MLTISTRQFLLFLLSVATLTSCKLVDFYFDYELILFENGEAVSSITIAESQTVVLRSRSMWSSFWHEHVNRDRPLGFVVPLPEIAFEKYMLIGMLWGDGYGDCTNYSKAIRYIETDGHTIRVHVGPLPDLGKCRMMVEPMQMARIDRTDLPVRFSGQVPGP